jgi:hypothetical protein
MIFFSRTQIEYVTINIIWFFLCWIKFFFSFTKISLSKPNFMKFHKVMKFHEITQVDGMSWISWNSWNFSWNFIKLLRYVFLWKKVSWNISWNFMKNFIKHFIKISWTISWNFVHEKSFMKFHEIFHDISWLHGTISARDAFNCKVVICRLYAFKLQSSDL